jgi:hypothetical protein
MSSGIADREFSIIRGKRNRVFSRTRWGSLRRFEECGSEACRQPIHRAYADEDFSHLRRWALEKIQGKSDGCQKVDTPSVRKVELFESERSRFQSS